MTLGEDISKRRFFSNCRGNEGYFYSPMCTMREKYDLVKCKVFAIKPLSYMENEEDCPEYVAKV